MLCWLPCTLAFSLLITSVLSFQRTPNRIILPIFSKKHYYKSIYHKVSTSSIDGFDSSASPAPDGSRNGIFKYYDNCVAILRRLRQKEYRKEIFEAFRSGMSILLSRYSDGIRDSKDKGKRGEEWAYMQAFVYFLFLFGLPRPINHFVQYCGLFSMISGAYLSMMGHWELKECISPFVVPTPEHKLVTSGVYKLVRHPIYGGTLLFFAGFSTCFQYLDKAIVSIIIAVVLVSRCECYPRKKFFWDFLIVLDIDRTKKPMKKKECWRTNTRW